MDISGKRHDQDKAKASQSRDQGETKTSPRRDQGVTLVFTYLTYEHALVKLWSRLALVPTFLRNIHCIRKMKLKKNEKIKKILN